MTCRLTVHTKRFDAATCCCDLSPRVFRLQSNGLFHVDIFALKIFYRSLSTPKYRRHFEIFGGGDGLSLAHLLEISVTPKS